MGETVGGALRRGRDRILAGVCSGLAEYFHVDATLVRVVFALLTLVPPALGILLYLVLWFLMEPADGLSHSRSGGERIRRMGDDLRREFGGAWHRSQSEPPPGVPLTPTDPTAIPSPGPRPPSGSTRGGRGFGHDSRGMWAGIILILLGAYFLLDNLGYLRAFRWDLFWPVILIALGLLVLLRRYR